MKTKLLIASVISLFSTFCYSQNFYAENFAAITRLKLNKFTPLDASNDLEMSIKNMGTTAITSVEINWNDGTDHIASVNVNIAAGASKTVKHPVKVTCSEVIQKDITVTVTKVNGVEDPDVTDNTGVVSIAGLSQVVPKKVVLEEGTGTWCGWCPRGMVALNKVNADHPDDQISIAVHNSDPMVVAAYNSGAAFAGFPGMNVDRELLGVNIAPSSIGSYVTTRKNIPTPVLLGGEYTIEGSTLTVNASAQFFSNFGQVNYRLAAVVIEDGVTGTAAGYRQANYYAGGGNGPMGGFEHLPNPVPAADMVYDHVGRALLGGYHGQENSVPTAIADQQVVNYTFTYTIPSGYNPEELHVALLLIDQSDKTIINGAKLPKGAVAAVSDVSLAKSTTIYPNPASTNFNIKFAKDGKYNVVIYDMSGRVVTNYGSVSTSGKTANLPIRLLPGKYLVNISQYGVSYTKELLVK